VPKLIRGVVTWFLERPIVTQKFQNKVSDGDYEKRQYMWSLQVGNRKACPYAIYNKHVSRAWK